MRVFEIEGEFGRHCKNRAQELRPKELDKHRAITLFEEIRIARVVCQMFGMGRAILYRWLRRFDPKDLTSLREESRCPRRVRKPLWSREMMQAVKVLREEYPRWGKDKLAVLVREQGQTASVSTVGRIVNHLKRRGELKEPQRRAISGKPKSRRPMR